MDCKQRLLFVAVAMLGIAYIDATCGPELSPWVAYIAPVAVAARYCSFSIGAFYAVVAGLLICLVAKHTGHPYSSAEYFLFATLSQTLVFLVIGWFASQLANLEQTLRRILADRSRTSSC